MNEEQEEQVALTTDQVNDGLELWKRIGLFRKEMTMREVRLLKKCQEDPQDTGGVVTGVLWLLNRRENPAASFDHYLDKTEEAIIAELQEKLPQA